MLGGVNSDGGDDEDPNTSASPDAPIISSAADNVEPSTGELESGSDTNDTTPTLIGTAGAGSSVAIYDGNTLLDTVEADGDGNWALEFTAPLTEGEHSLTAVATDPEGNISDTSDAFIITIDTLSPDAPELENTDGTTLTGTGEPGATVEITDGNGNPVATTEVGEDGTFSVDLDPMPEDGTELTATATDPAGNTSGPSNPVIVDTATDTTPPAAGENSIAFGDGGDGFLNADEIGNVTLSGTIEDGLDSSNVQLVINDGAGGSVTVDTADITVDGTILTVAGQDLSGLAEGELTATLTVTDDSNNAAEFTADSVKDTVTDTPTLNDTDGTTLSGTGEPGATIDITDGNGNPVATTEVGEDGTFSVKLDPTPEDGTELTATATDPAGNTSGPSNPVTVDSNTDTTPPAEGENSIAFGDGGDGFLNADEIGNVTLSGTIEDGLDSNNVQLVITDGEGGSVTVDPADITVDGTLLTVAGQDLSDLAEGELTATLTVTDNADNDNSFTADSIKDTIAPDAPILEPTDGTTLAGTGEPGASVEITDGDGNVVDIVDVEDDGNFEVTLDPALEDGTELTATATDPAGNASGPSNPVVVDTATDTTPPAEGDNSIAFTDGGDGFLSANEIDSVTLSGTVEEGLDSSNVQLVITDGEGGSVTVDPADITVDGTLLTVAGQDLSDLAEGELTATLTVTDNAGNDNSFTADSIKDTIAPDAPILEPTDGTTLAGTGEPGASVEITDGDGNVVDIVDVEDDGNFEVTLDPALEDGTELTATATDPAGNASGPSNPVVVDTATDTTPPAEGDNSIAFTDGGDGFLSANEIDSVTLSGTVEEGLDSSNVQLVITDGAGGSITVDTADIIVVGTEITVYGQDLSDLAEGELTATLTVTDVAGNANTFTDASVKDTIAPTTTVTIDAISEDTGTAGDFITSDNDGLTITATLDAALADDETLQYSIDGSTWVDIPEASVEGILVSYDSGLTESATVQLRVQDAAGNNGPATSQDVVIDATLPSADENSIAFADGGDGFLNADEIGNVTLSGTIEDGLDSNNVQLVITDGEGGSVTVDTADITVVGTEITVDGQDLSDLAEGELTATLTVTDVAGNANTFTDASVKDTIAPTTTVTIDAISEDTGTAGDFITSDNDGLTITATLDAALADDETLQYSIDGSTWVDIPEASVEGILVSYDSGLTESATVQLRVQDVAGNTGPAASQDVVIDATLPSADENSIAFADGGDGFLNADEIGNVTLSGTIEDGLDSNNVQLVITDGEGGSVTVDTADITVVGTEITVDGQDLSDLAEGELTATLTVTDVAGNANTFTDASVKDTIAPTTTVTIDAISEDTGTAGDFITSDNDGLTITATLDAALADDETLQYSIDGSTWVDIPEASVEGILVSYDSGLTESATVQLRVQDAAGNNGPATSQDVVIDATLPSADENSIAFADGGDGFLNADEIGNVTLSGTIEDGLDSNNVQLVITDGEGGSVTVDTADITVVGTEITVDGQDLSDLAEGELTATLTVTDVAGNANTFTDASVKDTIAPTTTVTIDAISEDTGTAGDFITSDNDGLTITATLDAALADDETLQYSIDGSTWVDIPEASVEGILVSYDSGLTESATVQLRVQDVAGNTGPAASQDVVIDATLPSADENSIAFADGGDGFLNADEIGNVTLSGTIEDGLDSNNVQLVITDGEGGSVTVDTADITVVGTEITVDGQDLSDLAEGELTATLTVTDVAGNANTFTDASVKDTIAPTTTVTIDAISEDTGTAGDFITSDNDGLTITATLDAALADDETLQYSIDGSTWVDIPEASVEGILVSYDSGLTESATVQLRVQDVAGNTGPAASQDVVIDATLPSADENSIAFADGGDGFLNADEIGNVTLSGTIEDGLDSNNVQLVITDGEGGSVTVDTADITVVGTEITVDGQDLSDLAEGELTATLTVTDVAGNANTFTDASVKDTIAPTTTVTIDAISEDTGTAGDFITSDNDGLTITATLDAALADDETLQYSIDGSTWVDIPEASVEGILVSYDSGLTESATVQLRVQDAAGNNGPATSQDVVIDATLPSADENSIAFADGGDGFLNADEIGNVTLSGTIEDGLDSNNVQLVITDGEGGSVTVDTADITVVGTEITVDGQDLSDLAEGELTATLTVTDVAGNANTFTDASVKDTIAPTTTVTIDAISEDTGTAGDFITSDNDGLTITATLDAALADDETLQYSIDGSTWVDIPEASVEGILVSYDSGLTESATVQLRVQDAAGNNGPATSQDVVIDATLPSADENSIAFADGGDGFLNADEIGNVTLSGTIEDGLDSNNVQLVITDGEGGSVTVDTADITVVGTEITVDGQDLSDLAEGELTATLTVTDVAGNANTFTDASVKDTIAPTTTVTIDAISEDTGTAGDFITSDNDGLTITATLDAALADDETLQYSIDGSTWVDIPEASVEGILVSYDSGLTESATVQLRVQDAAGNNGPATSQDVVIDATLPSADENSIAFADGGDGFLNADEIGNVTLSGTIEDGLDSNNVQLVITDGEGGSVTVDTADITVVGTEITVDGQDLSDLAEGELTATLTVTDVAGNANTFTDASVKDTIAPTTTVTIDAISEDTGTAGDFITSDNDGLTITATLDAALADDETLQYSIDGSTWVDIPEASVEGILVSYDSGLTESATVQLRVQDAAGNNGPATSQDVVIDATLPSADENSIAFADGGDGFLNADEIGNVTLSGTIEDGLDSNNVQLVITDGEGGSVTVDTADITVVGTEITVDGQDLSDLAEGELTATLTVTDVAGNANTFTDASVKDTIAPTTTVTIDAISEDTGTAGDFITSDNDGLTITATLDAALADDETLQYSIDGSTWVDIPEASVEGILVSYDSGLTESATVQLRVQDVAGNTGPAASQDVVIDATLPSADENSIAFADGGDGFLNADEIGNVTLSGTIEDGLDSNNVQLVITDGEGGSVTVDTADITVVGTEITVDGQDLSDLAEGELTATLTVTDVAGNANTFTDASVKDTIAPTTTVTIDAISEDTGTAGDFITSDNDGLTITATLDAALADDETLQYSIDGSTWVDIPEASVEGILVSYDSGLTESATVQLRVQDAAGNNGPATSQDVVIDATLPSADENSIAFADGGDGFLNADEIGNVTLSGTIEDGLDSNNVQLVITDGEGGSVTVDTADITVVGTEITVDGQDLSDLAEGELTATLTVTDVAGNANTFTDASVKDTIAPTTTVTIDAISEDTGTAGDFITSDNDGLTITATLDAALADDETLQYSIDGSTWVDIPEASVEGILVSYDSGLTESATVQLRVQDAAGNNGPATSQDVVIDATLPSADENSIAFADGGDGFLNADEIGNVTLSGTIEDGLDSNNVQLVITDGEGGSVTVDTADITVVGTEITVDGQDLSDLAEGELTATLTVTDVAGNANTFTDASVKDTIAPTTTVTIDAISEDTGTAGDFITSDNDGLTITATLDAALADDETLQYSIDGSTWVDIPEASVEGILVSYDSGLTESATVQLRVQDAAGNNGPATSQDVVIDATLPSADENSIAFADGGDGFLNADEIGNVTLSGTIEDGLDSNNVQLVITDGEGGSVTVDTADITVVGTEITVDGQDLSDLAEGELTATLTVTDVAGNANTFTDASVKDTIAPTTTVTIDAISEDTGTAGDFITSDNDGLTITATLDAALADDETLQYSIDGSTWVDIPEASVEGILVSYDSGLTESATVQLRVQDAAGNNGPATSQDVVIDATLPSADENSIAFADGGDGFLNADEIGNVTLSGTIEDGLDSNNVQLVITDGEGGSVTVDTADITVVGTEITVDGQDLSDLAEGELTATLTVTDVAGNANTFTDASVKDTIAPTTTVTIDAISEDTGTAGDFITSDNDGLTITATLDAALADDETLQYSIDGSTWVDIPEASVEGILVSYDSGLTESATVQLRVQDAAGNNGPATSQDVVIDATLPSADENSIAFADGGDGFLNADEIGNVTLSGTIEDGLDSNNVQLVITDGEGGSVTVDTADITVVGTEITVDGQDLSDLAEGELTATLTVTDVAGNANTFTDASVKDTIAPTTTVTIDAISEDTGTAGDFITSDNDGLTITATLDAALADDETLQYSIDGSTWVDIPEASVEGILVSYDSGLTESATVQLRVQDVAGNTGPAASQDVVIDATLPSADENSIAFADGGDGFLNADEIGNVTLSGTIEDGLDSNNVQLVITDGEGGSVTVDTADITVVGTEITVDGQDLSDLAEGELTATLTVTDVAGNANTFTDASVKDTIAPTTTVTIDAISEDTGTAGDFITSDNDGLTITATLDAALADDETLQYSIDGSTWVDIPEASVEGILVSYDSGLTESATVQLRVQDAAGNTGPAASQDVVIDATLPSADENSIAFADGGDGFLNADEIGNVTLSGTIEDGLDSNNVQLVITDGEGGSVTVDTADITVVGTEITVDGQDLSDLAEGELTATLTVTDVAGNANTFTDASVKDTIAPTTTVTIDAISEDTGTAGDFITSDNDGLTITATLDAALADDETLQYSIDGSTWVDIPEASVEGILVSYDSGLTESATVQLRVQDAAGNNGPATSQDVVIDATLPSADENSIAFADGGDGFLNADEIGNVTLSGTIEDGLDSNNVQLVITDGEGGSVTVDTADITVVGTEITVDGQDLSDLAEGELTATLTVTDVAGNANTFTDASVKDTIAPTTTVTIDAISEDTGTAGDFITSDNDGLTITATLDAALADDETLQYSIDGSTWVDIPEASVEGILVSYDSGLTESATVQFRVQDAAGNTGPATSQDVVIDATAPSAADNSIDFVDGGDETLSLDEITSVQLTGAVENGIDSNDVVITITDSGSGSITVDVADITITDGILSISGQDLSGLAEGELTVTMNVTDAAGNSTDFIDTTTKDTVATLGTGSTAVTEDALSTSAPVAAPALMAFSFASFAALPASDNDAAVDDTVSTGQLSYTNVSDTASFALEVPTDATLTQDSVELDWVLSEDGKTLQAVNPDTTETVLQITIDDTGTYKTELFSTLDHSLQGEDSLNFAVGVTLTDGDDVLTSDISVKVVDDVPEITSYQYEEVTAGAAAVSGNLLETAGFGADGGYISSITFEGVTFSIEQDALTQDFNVTTSGASELLDLSTPASVTNGGMTLTTLLGETFTLDLVTGAYTYDYDGELAIVDDGNTLPTPAINQSGGLLGIINLDALGLIDISEQQVFTVSDPDNDLTSVSLEYSVLLSLTGFEWAYNDELATELGLKITPTYEPGFLGLASSATLTITPIEAGSTMDAQAVNELLATVFLPNSVLGLDVIPTVTLSATDSEGTVDTSTTELLDLSLLTSGGSGATILTGTDNADLSTLIASADTSTRLYGYDGNDTIIGSSAADILRGGADNDTMNGAAGSDLMIGGTGNDTMTGGDGVDIFRWEEGHAGEAGAPATDTITDFAPSGLTAASPGDIIDLRTLLQGEGYVTAEISNLSRYLSFAEQGDDTVLSISTTGAFTGETTDSDLVDQIITFEGTSLLQVGEDSADLIARLISEGKLLVDEATSTTLLEDITREVDLTFTDGDGDSVQGKLEFSGDAPSITDTSNSAPTIVGASQQLLGLVGLDALGLVDLSQNALFVADADGNLQSVTIAFSPLLNVDLSSLLGAPALTVNTALAEEFGLVVETTSSAGLLGLLAPSASVTISAAEGETIDNLQINELLGTLDFNQSDLLSLSLLDYLTVSATDDDGATTSLSLGSLLDANVLDSGEGSSVFIDESGADVLDASAASINVSLYGLEGDDVLTGGSGNDLLRGGEGNDTLTGGAGNDLLFGEAGDNTFDGGLGDDTIVASTLDFSIDGGLGEDTVQFDGTGESIDLSSLLDANTGTSEMLNIEVLDISESSETGSTLTLDTDAVLNLTDDDDTLRIEGDSNDSVQANGAEMTGQEVINGATYDTYALGSATLYIDQDVTVTTNNA
nr:Ig-like domain-containing protein [Cobetia amphilecti]